MSYNITRFRSPVQTGSCLNILIDIIVVKSAESRDSDLISIRIQSENGSNSRLYNYPSDFVSASENTIDSVTTYTLQVSKQRTNETPNIVGVSNTESQTLLFTNKLAPVRWFLNNVIVENRNAVPILKKDNSNLSSLDLSLLDFKYSLDNNTYTNSPPEDLNDGNYTLFVKDYIGCTQSFNFKVSSPVNYTLDSFEVSESSTPCETVVVDFIVKRGVENSALKRVIIQQLDGFGGQTYEYPADFITTNSYEENGFVFYELELIKNRIQTLLHRIVISTVNQEIKIVGEENIPVRWFLDSVDVASISPSSSTASGFLVKSNSVELTSNEKNVISIEASLDGVDYGPNTIAGIEDGNYTYYVRDSFGCVQSLDFLVGDPVDENPEIFVSLLNSVRFAKRNNQIRNTENELSYEDQTDTNYQSWLNKYPVGQNLRFQYQSSYKDNEAYLIKDNDEVIKLNVVQLTDNRNVKDIRDGDILFNGTELFVSYPEGGNIYNEQGDVIGANRLNGSLLSYNEIGTFIEIEDIGVLKISNFKTLESGDEAMVFNYTSNQGAFSFTKKVTTTFTKQKLNYYEFQANGFTLGCYQIAICDSNNFDDQNPLESVKYLSERILITDDLEKHHQIKWSNSENNQIGWSTGITSEIYIPFVMPPTFEPEGENDVYSTDTRQFLLESEVFENYNFHLDLLPLAIARQVQLLLSNDNLLIDDLNYVKKETPEIEAKEGSNLYLVRPKLSRSTNYNSNSNLGQTINNNPSTIDGSKGILKLN